MEQLTRTKVEQFHDARKIQILENIDTGVSYDCTIVPVIGIYNAMSGI